MSRVLVGCAVLASLAAAAPAPDPGPVPVAPAPRPVKPELSLIVIDLVSNPDGSSPYRVLRVGFRNGVMFPPETIWEGEPRFFGLFRRHRLVADRYLVSGYGGIVDIPEKKVINNEQDGDVEEIDGMTVIYRVENDRREEGIFSFDLATREVRRVAKLGEGKYGLVGVCSPDGTKAIATGVGLEEEVVLHRIGQKPKSLARGFVVQQSFLASLKAMIPVLWLDNDRFLTQRANGVLVMVDLQGKVTELATIKDARTDLISGPELVRDSRGEITYVCGQDRY